MYEMKKGGILRTIVMPMGYQQAQCYLGANSILNFRTFKGGIAGKDLIRILQVLGIRSSLNMFLPGKNGMKGLRLGRLSLKILARKRGL